MQTRLSIRAWTEYDPHIWDGFSVHSDANRQAAIDYICLNCAELGCIYSDPVTLKDAIRLWTTTHKAAWDRIWETLAIQYEPLYNYDRHEEWSDTGSSSATASSSGNSTTKVAGYNQTTPALNTRDSVDSSTSSGSNSNTAGDHDGHIYGNIGVTTSAQMLNEEVDTRLRVNFYMILLKSFKEEFCIQIY